MRDEQDMPAEKHMVQWRYRDQEKWHSYGADAVSPPIIFDVLSEAREVFEKMVLGYYADIYRITDVDGKVVIEKPSSLAVRLDRLPSSTTLWEPNHDNNMAI